MHGTHVPPGALLVLLFLAGWLWLAPLVPASQQPGPTPPAGDPARGETLFGEHCAPCHGERGQGRSAASLAPAWSSTDPFAYVREATARGIPGTMMPAWGKTYGGPLVDADLDDIAAFVAGLPDQPAELPPRPAAPAARQQTGVVAVAALLAALALAGAVALRAPSRAKPPAG